MDTNNKTALQQRMTDIEAWFRWHVNHPDEVIMREEYKRVTEQLNPNTLKHEAN